MKVQIAADGVVEKVTVLRASAAKVGDYVATYVKNKWRFMAPKDDKGRPTRVEYLQAFNYEFMAATPAEAPAPTPAAAAIAVAKSVPMPLLDKPIASSDDSLFVRQSAVASDDNVVSADLPTAGAMRSQKQVLIDPQVLKVLVDSKPAFKSCGEGDGVVKTSFVIGESGTVARAHVRSSTLDDTKLEHCVLSTLSKLMFPKPRHGEPMLVLYPIVFR